MKTAVVFLAEGFEEIEAIVPIDVWRRAGIEVTTVGLTSGLISATRKTVHQPDKTFEQISSKTFDLIFLPGGRPGADNLSLHLGIAKMVKEQLAAGRYVAAICAAPLALEHYGVLHGRKFTCHPSVRGDLSKYQPSSQRVVVDGNLITSTAAGSAMEMALKVVEILEGPEKVATVNQGLFCPESLLP